MEDRPTTESKDDEYIDVRKEEYPDHEYTKIIGEDKHEYETIKDEGEEMKGTKLQGLDVSTRPLPSTPNLDSGSVTKVTKCKKPRTCSKPPVWAIIVLVISVLVIAAVIAGILYKFVFKASSSVSRIETKTDSTTTATTPEPGLPSTAREGEVFLLSSENNEAYEGLLVIYHDNSWGSVCVRGFDGLDARVACRQLGLTAEYAEYFTGQRLKDDNAPVWLSDVGCTGTETSLLSCRHSVWGNTLCSHSEDVGIRCPETGTAGTEGQVRLLPVEGQEPSEGTLLIYHNGEWGSICSRGFEVSEARVACRQLNLTTEYAEYFIAASFRHDAPVWLGGLDCSGEEGTFMSCRFAGWGAVVCPHSKDISVRCPETGLRGNEGQLSLRRISGRPATDGVLMLYHDGQWGSVCQREFDGLDAQVACRQLNMTWQYANFFTGYSLEETAPIWLSNVDCIGTESTLLSCGRNGQLGRAFCLHTGDISISCPETGSAGIEGQLRLQPIEGKPPYEGILMIYHDGQWGAICNRGFDGYDAKVACKQLNLTSDFAEFFLGFRLDREAPVWLADVECTGTESAITSCPHAPWRRRSCNQFHLRDVSIRCPDTGIRGTEGQLHLLNKRGGPANEGILMIYHEGEWGSICSNLFDNVDARVACRELGLNDEYAVAFIGDKLPPSAPVWTTNVECTGEESSLLSCERNDWKRNSCLHRIDVNIRCPDTPPAT